MQIQGENFQINIDRKAHPGQNTLALVPGQAMLWPNRVGKWCYNNKKGKR
jgi:hypothetical protein